MRRAGALLATFGLAPLCGCGTAGGAAPRAASSAPPAVTRFAIERYLDEVEPVRRGVNRLLEGADPILRALAAGHTGHRVAAGRMARLEHRFAAYAVRIAAVEPPSAPLRALNTPYAETYVLEDAYLSALAAGIREGRLEGLPHTEDAQRAAIVRWRTRLTVLADRAHAQLPRDLEQAGRGEIAPSPDGS